MGYWMFLWARVSGLGGALEGRSVTGRQGGQEWWTVVMVIGLTVGVGS